MQLDTLNIEGINDVEYYEIKYNVDEEIKRLKYKLNQRYKKELNNGKK
jgi:hypothetical protein